jgi:hypothetical protein
MQENKKPRCETQFVTYCILLPLPHDVIEIYFLFYNKMRITSSVLYAGRKSSSNCGVPTLYTT